MATFDPKTGYWLGESVQLKGQMTFRLPDPTPEAGWPGPMRGAAASAARAERRILAGENRVAMPYLPGDIRRIILTVPTWHREPIKRLRVEWARWKARR